MKQITLLAVEGCLSSSISNLIDAFTIANLWHRALSQGGPNLFETKVVTSDGKPVTCSNCIQIQPHFSFKDARHSDYLVVPALLPVPESAELQDLQVLDYICRQYSLGTTVASVCTGTFLLAETGLLNGRSATTNWQFEKKFRFRHPHVNLKIGKILTEEDNLICSGAVSAIMHLALKIIRREGTVGLASMCAKAMLVDPNNESQAPYTTYPLPEQHRDAEILKAETYMREHLAANFSIDMVAEVVCISPRHFKRRFKSATGESPLNYLQKLRIQVAKDRLENSLESIEEITHHIGYEDSSTFRRLFKRHTSLSPREYRDRFLVVEKA
jgi:transcriptional regulator GlxA family with amidase domain